MKNKFSLILLFAVECESFPSETRPFHCPFWAIPRITLRHSPHFTLPSNSYPDKIPLAPYARFRSILSGCSFPESPCCFSLCSSLRRLLPRSLLVPSSLRRSQARRRNFLGPSRPSPRHSAQRQQSGISDRRSPSRRRRALFPLSFPPRPAQSLLVCLPPRQRPHPHVTPPVAQASALQPIPGLDSPELEDAQHSVCECGWIRRRVFLMHGAVNTAAS